MTSTPHGSEQGWRMGCRETCCTKAHQAFYDKRRSYHYQRGGRTLRVSPDKSREHLRILREKYGWSHMALAKKMNLDHNSLHRLVSHDLKFIYASRESQVLALPLEYPTLANSEAEFLNPVGSTRRLQAMGVRGFTKKWIADRVGLAPKTIFKIQNGRVSYVLLDTAKKIRDVLNSSLLIDPEENHLSVWARRRADELGWQPLGAWNDIDDPEEVPEGRGATEFDTAMNRIRATRARGFSLSQMSEASGITTGHLSKFSNGTRSSCSQNTLARIQEMCDHFDTLPDPDSKMARELRTRAENNGWKNLLEFR